MRSYLKNSCEVIDAAVFSGDVLYCDDDRAKLCEYVERWSRAIKEHEQEAAAEKAQERRDRVKKLAHKIDPVCWVSYSGKEKDFKRQMDFRRTSALAQAERIVDEEGGL